MRKRNMVGLVAYIVALVINSGCKDSGVGPGDTLADNLALYVSLDGGSNNAGLWILDPNSFALLDSLGTGAGVPFTVEFSPDYSRWYSIWTEYPSKINYLHTVDNSTMDILHKVPVKYPNSITADKDKRFLVTYPYKPLLFFDLQTVSLLHQDTTFGMAWNVVSLANKRKLCMSVDDRDRNFLGVAIYNLNTFTIERIIPVADVNRQRSMQPAALALSPDDRYAFLSVFNWRGGGGYNSFFVIDLVNSTVLSEYICGAFAQLAVSPDGRHVYISDPAGYRYMMIPTNEILVYNIETRTLNVFIHFNQLGLPGINFTSNKIVLLEDNRTMFVDVSIKTYEGRGGYILKMDTLLKRVLAKYSLPVSENGFATQEVVNMRLGVYQGQGLAQRR